MHSASTSSKLSNLLKSRSSSVSADRTRSLPGTGDLYTGPESVAPLGPLITRGHQTSRAFAKVFRATRSFLNGRRVTARRSTIDVAGVFLFAMYARSSYVPPIENILSPVNATRAINYTRLYRGMLSAIRRLPYRYT